MQATNANTEILNEEPAAQRDLSRVSSKLSPKFWIAFSAMAITNLAAALDATTLSVALPAISAAIGGSGTEAFWAGTSYLLASTIMMLLWVDLSEVFGRRPVMLFTLIIFGAGAIPCAVASNYQIILLGRTIQGLGGGGVVGLTTVLITDMVPLRDRGRFYALIGVVWAIGSTSGPIIGGALAQTGSWRWIFWLNLPIVFVGFAGIAFFLNLSPREHSVRTKLKTIDYLGSVLFIASITSFLVPLTWGGIQFPWQSWHTIVPLIIGSLGLVGFVLYEMFIASKPLVPVSIFLDVTTSIIYLGSLLHGLILYSLVYYMPEYFQAAKLYSPIISGVAALPQTLTVVPCAIAVGVVVGLTGRYRWALWSGWFLTTLGCGLLIKLNVNTSIVAWIFLQAVSGLGIGLLFPSIALAIQASVPQTEVAMSATLVLFFRSFGQALGVAVGGTILNNRMQANLRVVDRLDPGITDQAASSAVSLVAQLKALPRDSPVSALLRESFAKSFQTIWAVMCSVAGLILIAHLFVKEYDMNQVHVTQQAFVDEKNETTVSSSIHASEPGISNFGNK